MNHVMIVNLYHPYIQFQFQFNLSHRRTRHFMRIVTFSIIQPYKYSF